MGKHTTGPWNVGTGENSDSVMAKGYFIATCHDAAGYDSDDRTIEYNAKLIAAAPDLLEALQSALQTAKFEKHAARPWHHEARAAIKKATQ